MSGFVLSSIWFKYFVEYNYVAVCLTHDNLLLPWSRLSDQSMVPLQKLWKWFLKKKKQRYFYFMNDVIGRINFVIG